MATIKDIAKAAGVSITTVSRALNGYSDVSEKTREKIKLISQKLNYSPNILARSLVMNKTRTIGLLVSEISRRGAKDNFTFEVLTGINDRAGELGYDLILFSTDSSKQRLKTYAQLCRERKVDGVILQGIKTDDPYLQEVVESEIPCVLIDIPVEGKNVGYVTTDNVLGAKQAVKHLIDLGHKNIAMVNGYNKAFVSKDRLKGYQLALKEAGLNFNKKWVVDGAFKEEIAKDKTINLLKAYPEITAIFSASDMMALGVMNAIKELGRKVPQELAVVGYDDIILASYFNPPLTTVAQNKYKMGCEAAGLLIEMLEGTAAANARIIETKLIIRESSATAARI